MEFVESVFIINLSERYENAINTAEPIGSKDSILNRSEPGWTITNTPMKPRITAANLLIPSFSPKIGTARIVAMIGPLWAKATFSESSKNFRPKK